MDKPQYTSVPLDELRRIESESHRTDSIDDLRALFDRLQSIKRTFIDDFNVQLAVGEVQQSIVDRGHVLLKNSPDFLRELAEPESPETKPYVEPPRTEAYHPQDPRPAAEQLPADVQRIDAGTWKRATYLGAFFAIILFAVFFYLVLTAKKLYFAGDETQTAADGTRTVASQQKKPGAAAPVPAATTPALRLYTDLVPGTVTIDAGAPQSLQDGELQLDGLKAGRHTVRLSGRMGEATLEFDSSEKNAPRLSTAPLGIDAMVVAVSTEKGQGKLMTNAVDASAVVDNKDLGPIAATGLDLPGLGEIDHDLQIKKATEAQRFILTYIPQPALTVFVKSDLNAGSLVILTGEDGVDVTIDNEKYKRKSDHGQLRIPNLKVGAHTVKVAKQGFNDAPPQTVQIKKGEEARLVFKLQGQPQVASLQLKGAASGTQVFLDGAPVGVTTAGGTFSLSGLKPGDHLVELRHEGAQPKQIQRSFKAGEAVSLSGADVVLAANAPAPAAEATAAAPDAQKGPSAPPAADNQATAPQEPATPEPVAEAQPANMPGAIHRGGGFLIYHTTKAPGRYSFTMQLRRGGGFLKSKRLQWFVGYKDTKNYILFQVDGKRFSVRQVIDGKSEELQKLPFDADPEHDVQIDLAVKAGSVQTRLRPSDGSWENMGSISIPGENLTQGKFGVLIAGNEEVGVSTVHYGK